LGNSNHYFDSKYLFNKTINPTSKEIVLTYGGLLIKDSAVDALKLKLNKYYLQDSNLKIQQGFSYLNESNNNEQEKLLTIAINEKAILIENLSNQLDSIYKQKTLTTQIYKELKAQYPSIENFVLQPSILVNDSMQKNIWISNLKSREKIDSKERNQIKEWLKVRLNTDEIIMNYKN
jgi:hypothetical protein